MNSPGSPEDDDLDLISGVARGNPDAMALLYDRHAPRVLGLLVRLLKRRSDAEDVLQETFLQAWKGATGYDPGRASPLTWLLLIARSRALDYLRRPDLGSRVAPAEPGEQHSPLADLERDESARQLRHILMRLPGPQREAIALAFFEGMSHSQIADAQQASLGTIKTRIRLGLHRLREFLEESEKGPDR